MNPAAVASGPLGDRMTRGGLLSKTVSRRSFRSKLFLALFLASILPVALIFSVGWFLVATAPIMTGTRESLDSVTVSYRQAEEAMALDTVSPVVRDAWTRHGDRMSEFTTTLNSALYYFNRTFRPTALVLFIGATLVGWLAIALLGRSLTRQLSAPLDELVDWTGRVRRREAIPTDSGANRGTSREFIVLQDALRAMQRDLNQARAAEIEAERLRAFGEVARRVAHEMKNPLTPIRLAVVQMRRGASPEQHEMLEVIGTESARLEAMAREFAQLGRLPDGVAAPVDLRELLDELLRSVLPEGIVPQLDGDTEDVVIEGYYDPLRRAFMNLLRNASEACGATGSVTVSITAAANHVAILIADTGPGIPPAMRDEIFLPYVTHKGDGTGLGLAIVRQTIEQHGGTIAVGDADGGGACFTIRLPLHHSAPLT